MICFPLSWRFGLPFRQSSSGDKDLCSRIVLLLTVVPVPTNRELSRSNYFQKKLSLKIKTLHFSLTCIYFSFLRISTGTRSGGTLHILEVFQIVTDNGSRSKIQKRKDETPLWANFTPEEKTLAIDRVESRQKICG